MIFGKAINRYYLKHAPVLLLGILSLLTVDYIQLLIPELYRLVINGVNLGQVVVDGQTLPFTREVLFQHICLPMIWIVVLMVIGRFLWRVCFFGSAVNVAADLRERMFDHSRRLSQQYYQVNKVGNLMSLYTNDLDTIQECFGDGILMFFDAAVLGIMALVKMWRMDCKLTLLALIPAAVMFVLGTVMSQVMTKRWEERQQAFSDLSDFPQLNEISAVRNLYEPLHELESRSVSGNLLTNIFAGGTTNTEWGFLTGYSQHEEFRGPINSYVRYFKDQGYDALYRHPGYSWFYNRSNVNEYLGFDECVFNESGFGDLISIEDALFKSDTVLVDYLLNDIDSRTEDDDPLFLFSVSYQNHGPYSSETYWEEYVTPAKTGWSMESCCVINNYLAGIRSTIEQMRRLTRELDARDEPVVLVLFGDHKPWMGNGSSVYAEMGVNLDVSTQDGFYNYFSTPYLIYANKAAKESLGQDFRGDGGDISPCFLMDKLFFECGWTGDGFMQLQRETRAVTPLMHEDGYRMVDGSITLDVPPDVAEVCRKYLCAQYYREQHFVSES